MQHQPRNELEEQEMRERLARLEERDQNRGRDHDEIRRKLDVVISSLDEMRRDWHSAKVLGRAAIGVVSVLGGVVGWALGKFLT